MAETDTRQFEVEAAATGPSAGPPTPGRRPHLAGAQLAAHRARLQAERVRAWKRWHAEMFEQLRLDGSVGKLRIKPPSDGERLGLDERAFTILDTLAFPSLNERRPAPAEPTVAGADERRSTPWSPNGEGRWQARPTFERTKAAAAETMCSTGGLLCQPAERNEPRGRFWSGLIDRITRGGDAPTSAEFDSGTALERHRSPAAAKPAARPLPVEAGTDHWPAAPATPGSSIAGARREDAAALEVYLGRMRARLLPPPVQSDAPPPAAPGERLPVPVRFAPPGPPLFESKVADRAPEASVAAPATRKLREPWFALAVYAWAFSMIAIPHALIEHGVLPARVASAISFLKERSERMAATSKAVAAPAARVSEPVAPSTGELESGAAWSDLYALGHDLLRADRLQEAAAAFKGAAELNPERAEIRHDLGYLLQRIGNHEAAIGQYQEAIALDPGHQQSLYNLAFLLHRAGRLEEALPLYAQAVRLFPKDPYVAFNYATLLEGRGEVARARSLFARAAAIGGATKIAGHARARLAQLEG